MKRYFTNSQLLDKHQDHVEVFHHKYPECSGFINLYIYRCYFGHEPFSSDETCKPCDMFLDCEDRDSRKCLPAEWKKVPRLLWKLMYNSRKYHN